MKTIKATSNKIDLIRERHKQEIEDLQKSCKHLHKTKEKYGNSTWVDDNGDDYIVEPSVCLDCGKILIPVGRFR